MTSLIDVGLVMSFPVDSMDCTRLVIKIKLAAITTM
jgi:hypothetical protein